MNYIESRSPNYDLTINEIIVHSLLFLFTSFKSTVDIIWHISTWLKYLNYSLADFINVFVGPFFYSIVFGYWFCFRSFLCSVWVRHVHFTWVRFSLFSPQFKFWRRPIHLNFLHPPSPRPHLKFVFICAFILCLFDFQHAACWFICCYVQEVQPLLFWCLKYLILMNSSHCGGFL